MKILVVEDNEDSRVLQKTTLEAQGHTMESAVNGKQALEMAMRSRPDLIISDILMPEMDGFALCQAVKDDEQLRTVPFVFHTASYITPEDEELAKALGATRFIVKTGDTEEFLRAIEDVIKECKEGGPRVPGPPAMGNKELDRMHKEALVRQLDKKVRELEKEHEALKESEEKLKEGAEKLRKTLEGTIQAFVRTVESRDPYTAGHQQRVADIACAVAREMGFSSELIDAISLGGRIHDLGKIAVPAEFLTKPGRITEMEFEIIKTHPQVGYDILKGIEFQGPIVEIVHQHHERMDGSGYPRGLSGEEIHIVARIVAVADTVEAMASHRPYRAALGIDAALDEISKKKGVFYDPDVVDACVRLFREKGFEFK